MAEYSSKSTPCNHIERLAAASSMRVFPIRIEPGAEGRMDKRPLVADWPKKANYHQLTRFDWSQANGYGIMMGAGYYALDIDAYKEGGDAAARRWMDVWNIPWDTRTHSTVSGGLHKIYATPNAYRDLRNRANIVPGLDGRGAGGFVAFGAGYRVVDERYPALIPPDACEEIQGGGGAAALSWEDEKEAIGSFTGEIPEGAEKRLEKAILTNRTLARRWGGDARGLVDGSRSSMDHSVARLLAVHGFDENLIIWALLSQFEHGAARYKPKDKVAIRAAVRSAMKGLAERESDRAAMKVNDAPELTPDQIADLKDLMRKGNLT